ncbi:MAG: 2-phosphosulfolactate phosphatase [Anaerolineales bacterium]|nr:2-phosphosulfolactate phosphatase [Anaerolineales bacterium]
MEIRFATLTTCGAARGVVVVIDVIRAFTTAAFAFKAGAAQIVPVGGVAEALGWRARWPAALVMGEVNGLPPAGFDFGNSPSALIGQDLRGRRLIQRTGAGTQGLVRSVSAEVLLAASFVNAAATVNYVQALGGEAAVTLLPTDHTQDEDQACAEYLAAGLRGAWPDPAPYLERVRAAGRTRIEPGPGDFGWPAWAVRQFEADLECCTALNALAQPMVARRAADYLEVTPA